jgi:hypothetical protein
MSRKLVGCGVAAFVACAAAGSAQAKLIRYEIDGKRYSYSTNNIQQTREARRRIEAANAASAARARAETERTANPIVKMFGSQTQREAAEAQARLQQTLASPAAPDTGADLDSTSSVKKSRVGARREKRTVEARAERRQTRAERRRAVREARLERRKSERARAQKQAALSAETPRAAVRKQTLRPQEARVEAAPKLAPVEIVQVKNAPPPAKSSLPEIGSEESAASLMDFVNQVRKALP